MTLDEKLAAIQFADPQRFALIRAAMLLAENQFLLASLRDLAQTDVSCDAVATIFEVLFELRERMAQETIVQIRARACSKRDGEDALNGR